MRTVAVAWLVAVVTSGVLAAQTREKGPWWPSAHGAKDQAGNSNYVTPEKILKALRLAKTGQTYELGRVYEPEMPQFGSRPYYLNVTPAGAPRKEGEQSGHVDYFNGYLGQMGTQFDALGHIGRAVRMADGTLTPVYYNGFTEQELTGRNRGQGGMEALGVEHARPIITRGILLDIAAYKGVAVLDSRYDVTSADLRGALKRQGIAEDSIEPGDAILLHLGWGVHWNNPSKYNDGRFGAGENQGSPGLGVEGARWLTAKKVVMVGADTCCVQSMPAVNPDPHNVHHELLFGGVYILENMDLSALARDRVYEFLYVTLPERIRGATGSPVRPLAIR